MLIIIICTHSQRAVYMVLRRNCGADGDQRPTLASSEYANNLKILNKFDSQQSGPISHIVWTDSILIFISAIVLKLK